MEEKNSERSWPVLSTVAAIDVLTKLQPELAKLSPKDPLVNFMLVTDEETRELLRIDIISSHCKSVPFDNNNMAHIQEAANNYLLALRRRLIECGYEGQL